MNDQFTIDLYDGKKKKRLIMDPADPVSMGKYFQMMMAPTWTRIVFSRPRPKKLPAPAKGVVRSFLEG
ncbi:MAG TPA: hypothetical protein VN915_06730 [Elusimicrobiota bacterium]|nr:hypothetical protein [Elusimicrobiota bacterium]